MASNRHRKESFIKDMLIAKPNKDEKTERMYKSSRPDRVAKPSTSRLPARFRSGRMYDLATAETTPSLPLSNNSDGPTE
mgnify:CR=1 FL=1